MCVSPLLSVIDVIGLLTIAGHTKMDANAIMNLGTKNMAAASKVCARFDVRTVCTISPLCIDLTVTSPLEADIVSRLSPLEAEIVSELSPLEADVLVKLSPSNAGIIRCRKLFDCC